MFDLKRAFTIVIVTHNCTAGRPRVSDDDVLLSWAMVETGPTKQIFTNPPRWTEAYIAGRFG
ncbi:MAG: hypothetical protein R2882_10335 [Gemmatimonadales bacterium]